MKRDLETSENIHKLILFNYWFNTDTKTFLFNCEYCEQYLTKNSLCYKMRPKEEILDNKKENTIAW